MSPRRSRSTAHRISHRSIATTGRSAHATKFLVPRREARRLLRREAARVDGGQITTVVSRAAALQHTMRRAGVLQALSRDGLTLIQMVRAYARGVYREIPFGVIAAIVAALLYVLNPFDLVPDAIPGIGYIDDAAVLSVCLRLVGIDLERFRQWQHRTRRTPRVPRLPPRAANGGRVFPGS